MKSPWNAHEIRYIYIYRVITPMKSQYVPYVFPMFFFPESRFFLPPRCRNCRRLQHAESITRGLCLAVRIGWHIHHGIAARLGKNSHGAMGGKLGKPFKTPWFAWKLCCFHVFHIFVDVFWFFLYVYRSVSIKNDGWSKKIWGINMKKPWKIGKLTENLAVMGTLVH